MKEENGLNKIELRRLGATDVMVPPMGIGTMLWDNRKTDSKEGILKAYRTCIDNGFSFFDTAEIYSNGASELMLGECLKKDGRPILIATKFAPPSKMIPNAPKRITVSKKSPHALTEALDNSLKRLGVDYIDLYQLHAPPSNNTIEAYMEEMAKVVKAGKVRAVGVCNFSADQLRKAHQHLAQHGIPLATTMVGYSMIRRYPESNGVFDACKELNITVIPYAPLAEGILTGKYRSREKKLSLAYKATIYFGHLDITKERTESTSFIRKILTKPRELNGKRLEPLFAVMDEIANAHNKTLAQIAINWLITTEEISVIPVPGVRNIRQIQDNLGAANWSLSKEERARISKVEMESH